MDAREAAAKWITAIDRIAHQANLDLDRAGTAGENPRDEAMPGAALLAIASQLAYGNAIAAASFYMANRLHIILDEGGPE